MKKEEKGREVLGWRAAIGNAIARQVTVIGDSDSDGVPLLAERDKSSTEAEEEDRDTKPILRRRKKRTANE